MGRRQTSAPVLEISQWARAVASAAVIQHVSIESRRGDAPALLRFLRALGFHEIPVPPTLAERSTWVQAGATQVHLLWADEPVVPPQGHFAVVAEDYDDTLDALRAEGFEPEPRAEHWGAPRSFVRSPGGHRVEVMAAPPPGR
jgi:catechol 2,3-dioxygenase-like lactoylglutathione lyase family enzyme